MERVRRPLPARARIVGLFATAVLIGVGVAGPPSTRAEIAAPAGALGSSTVSTETLGGATPAAVSVSISQRLLPKGAAPVVFLASSQSYADAVAAGPIAARDGGAILYTDGISLPAAVGQELIRLAPTRVEVLGGTAVITPAVFEEVSALLAPTTVVERVAGPDAAGTAAALSAETFAPRAAPTVFVASAASLSDAIAAGPAAASLGGPLLLALAGSLPPATAAELQRLAPGHVVVVGNTAAVSDGVLAEIDQLVPSVERVTGADAYATAAAVAARYFPGATTDVAVSGTGANGLPAVPIAAARRAPILFVQPTDLLPAPTRDSVMAAHPTWFVIAGAISEVVRAELVGFSDGRLTLLPAALYPPYPSYDSGYHDYGEMLNLIEATEIAYPNLVHVFSIGKSYEGRNIWAAEVSNNVSVEEGEPEVLVDTLHHADEHLGVEQALYLFNTLTGDYTTDPYVHQLVNSREIFFIFDVNPDGWAYDLSGGAYHFWRKNRQLNGGYYGVDINRNYPYRWACCAGSSAHPWTYNYRGPAPLSTPEATVVTKFVASRVINGVQMIRTHVTLHTNGELILYPYGYTHAALPSDMSADDYYVFAQMASKMAHMNGYTPEQSSRLYITDGDEIDWMYHQYHIFSFTFELYPPELGSLTADVYPPYSVVAKQTARNRGALLYLIAAAACPYTMVGLTSHPCGSTPVIPPPSGLMP